MKTILSFLVGVFLMGGVATQAMAAEKQDRSAKRAAILMQKMKQDLEAEKSALQTQFEQEKKGLSQALDQAQSAQKTHSVKLQGEVRRNQQLQSDNQKLGQEKSTLSAHVEQLQAQLAEQAQRLEATEQQLKVAKADLVTNDSQRKGLLAKVSAEHQQLLSCEEKNSRLYSYGHDLVNLYADASAYQRLMRAEPFFQLKRVELENILQAKQTQLLENKVDTIAAP
jgi:chromosome segregation ATPase